MRNRSLIYTTTVFVMVICSVGLSLESPAVTSPVGSGTVPPTTYKSGLVPSINPIDTSGNLVVTGNVAGEGYFRGVVPYGGVTDFWTPAGEMVHTSGAFDSFLRRTEGSQDLERSGGGLTPYYSPTLTVTTQIPGTRGVTTSQIPGRTGEEVYYRTVVPQEQTGYRQREYSPQAITRPLSLSREEMEKLIQEDVARYSRGAEPVSEMQSLEQFWRGMGIQFERRPGLEGYERKETEPQGLTAGTEPDIRTLLDSNPSSLSLGRTGIGQEKRLPGIEQEEKPESSGLGGMGQGMDVYEQMRKQLAKPAVGLEEFNELMKGENPLLGRQALGSSGVVEPNKPAAGISSAGISAIGRGGIAGMYESFASFSDDKFNKYIRSAESYMRQGKFYRAADAYTLATAYKPDDPLGYAGKSIALFATGEYMSSSLFLARALEIFPEYAKFRVDLVGIIGDKDLVENRILDAREWSTRSKSGELEFLLSYVYYQLDRMEFARQMIEAAVKKMPDSAAVAAMKKAIDERIANP